MNKRDVLRAEQRAAEIATSMIYRGRWPTGMVGAEMAGWMRAGDNRERGCSYENWRWQAGYLAARIWFETLYREGDDTMEGSL